jgi:hypothetical protein
MHADRVVKGDGWMDRSRSVQSNLHMRQGPPATMPGLPCETHLSATQLAPAKDALSSSRANKILHSF